MISNVFSRSPRSLLTASSRLLGVSSFVFSNCLLGFAWDGGTDDSSWTELKDQVSAKRVELETLISEAEVEGLTTEYAKVSLVVVNRFLNYAQFDRDHADDVLASFNDVWWNQKVPDQDYVVNLPFDELSASLDVAQGAIMELQAQLSKIIVLADPVDFTDGEMSIGDGSFLRNGKPVFPSDFTWMPNSDDLMESFGRMGGVYYALTDIRSDGTVSPNAIQSDIRSVESQDARNIGFQQFFIGHKAASWMLGDYPEIAEGGRNFVTYDTDSPLIREWFETLFDGYIPSVTEAAGSQPRMHLLANEPNWATRAGGWLADNGVSSFTKDKYRVWLTEKYTDVSHLNTTYGTSYADFSEAEAALILPIDPEADDTFQGGPIWYDWCRFNMDRINDWFSFLKEGAQSNDAMSAPATIKILGGQLSNQWRDDGLDMEYLANLMDVTGGDLHVVPAGATIINNKLDLEWKNHYSMDWLSQSMMLDFYKSLHPNKPYYDSEWHGLATNKWRDFSLDADYVRSSIWLGFVHGMNAIQTWVWGRNEDGSFADVNSDFIGDVLTQPIALDAYGRVMKELNAHAQSVTTLVKQDRHFMMFYSSESAIQDLNYVPDLEDVYESLKLLNLRVGFTTPSTLSSLDASKQTVIVSPTAFISDSSYAELVAFSEMGGRVVVVGLDSVNFRKTEHGVLRSELGVFDRFASFEKDTVHAMADELGSALGAVMPETPVRASIYDSEGEEAYGVFISQALDSETGFTTLSLVNVANEPRSVALALPSGGDAMYRNILTNKSATSMHLMEPYDVLLIRVEPKSDWVTFAQEEGLSGDPLADFDYDGMTDFYEYSIGNDPKSSVDSGTRPFVTLEPTGLSFNFTSTQRGKSQADIQYEAQWTENLLEGPWVAVWESEKTMDTRELDLSEIQHRLNTTDKDSVYFRLKVRRL